MKRPLASQLAAHPSRLLLLAPLAGLSLFGCAQIIGLDEYTVAKSSSAGAAPGGGAGKGGESGGNGKSGAASLGGEGGEAGSDAEAGGGGEAGGTQSPPVGCDGKTGFEPNAQIVRSCLLRAGCDPTFAPLRTISTCVTYNTQAALPGETCNLTSMTCADFEDCEHIGIAHDDLCGGTQATGTRCQGNLAINCGNYAGDDRFFDCAALGGTCGTLNYENVLFADCKMDIAPDSCVGLPSSEAQNFCHSGGGTTDDLRYFCWEGQAFGSSCSSLASCIDTPEQGTGGASAVGNAQCFYDTDRCQGPDSVSCSGDVATVCSGGSQFKYNCGSVGLSCDISAGAEYCLAPGCEPADVDSKCQESCSDDGASLTFCYGGAPFSVACKDYGFARCSTGTDSDTGQTFAACRF
ncbi:MAG TPA: hypothetical protein VJV79_02580 [Polyangiaceae bacterium]|nr:hypothetical protein [Polyangiaceae bacterium]